MASTHSSCALAAFCKTIKSYTASQTSSKPSAPTRSLPQPAEQRRAQSLMEQPFNLSTSSPLLPYQSQLHRDPNPPETILYLAYGSNLSAETFQKKRGIRPISAINVVVPDLVMTFDLPGVPYREPCFANTAYRTNNLSSPSTLPSTPPVSEKSPLLPTSPPQSNKTDYHKLHWHKGLIGVVYEVTPTDYAHIIATEGGGASYHDILIPCHPLDLSSPTVPTHPTTPLFKAHTLYSPTTPPGEPQPPDGGEGGRFSRPDPNYAQPSERYLNLITTGAEEHALPKEYQIYLRDLRAYTITSQQQRLGAWIFGMIWLPFISFVFMLFKMFADERGRVPSWLVVVSGAVFRGMWGSYDGFFRGLFGDGERTVKGDEGGDGEGGRWRRQSMIARCYGDGDDEKGRDVNYEV